MRKYIIYALDILLLLSGIAAHASSYVVWFILPHGMGAHGGESHCSGDGVGSVGNCNEFLGLYRYTWIEIHNWASVVFLVVVLIHIILHWDWIKATTKRVAGHFQTSSRKVLELYGSVVVLFILFVFDCLSGLILWLVLPRGVGDFGRMSGGAGRTFLGLQRNVWVDLHAWVAVTIIAIVIVHLILNWNWVAGVSKKIFWGAIRPTK